jgi:predicted branched-subunit amino acid permease
MFRHSAYANKYSAFEGVNFIIQIFFYFIVLLKLQWQIYSRRVCYVVFITCALINLSILFVWILILSVAVCTVDVDELYTPRQDKFLCLL